MKVNTDTDTEKSQKPDESDDLLTYREANNAQQAYARALQDALLAHKDNLSPSDALAVTAYFLGELVTYQDEKSLPQDACMDMILRNVREGNERTLLRNTEPPTSSEH